MWATQEAYKDNEKESKGDVWHKGKRGSQEEKERIRRRRMRMRIIQKKKKKKWSEEETELYEAVVKQGSVCVWWGVKSSIEKKKKKENTKLKINGGNK